MAFVSDINKAFHHNHDKDFVQFLWFEDVEKINVSNIEQRNLEYIA